MFLFPGQSSFYEGMLDRALSLFTEGAAIVDAASSVLKRDLVREYGSPAPRTSRRVQVGVFLTNFLHQAALESRGLSSPRSAGLSLGEYNHLVHTRAISFEDALALVDARGTVYDAGPSGVMVAIPGLSLATVREAIAGAGASETVDVTNVNAPTQHVIAGPSEDVARVVEVLEAEHFAAPIVIEQRIPMHSRRFAPVAAALRPHLERISWRAPELPYLPNVTGLPLANPDRDAIVAHLVRHVSEPVMWQTTMEHLAGAGSRDTFVEVGPRAVLSNLIKKRWLDVDKANTDAPPEIEARRHFEAVVEALIVAN